MSITAAQGFEAGGSAIGIKPSGAPDLAIVVTADRRPVPAAGVFTTNLATAAPVLVSRAHLADGHAAGVVLSSGNANAATGARGRADATRMCELAAGAFGLTASDFLVCSTGLIGFTMPMDVIEAGIPKVAADLNGATAAADALLTTDTVRKEAVAPVGTSGAVVGGMAKGAAMLAPAMATMLAVLTTDAEATPYVLERALTLAVSKSFNALCVDACTSTNDTVLVLASGAAGGPAITTTDGPDYWALVDAMTSVCASLARQMATDAEGATKLATIRVTGARTDAQAAQAARAVASSQLVQCSLNGEDPYWGRVLSELGASGAFLDQERVTISYGGHVVCEQGIEVAHDVDAVRAVMAARDIEIVADLGLGQGEAEVLFTDLSYAYIDENRGTS
jgi:glutamate N-acetyltransferase/amino-acid N-acetyltransferase